MISNSIVAARGKSQRYINSFNRDDYVFYYSKGIGIIGAGRITSDKPIEIDNGLCHNVNNIIKCDNKPIGIRKIKELCGHNFFWASTSKFPFLSKEECEVLWNAINS